MSYPENAIKLIRSCCPETQEDGILLTLILWRCTSKPMNAGALNCYVYFKCVRRAKFEFKQASSASACIYYMGCVILDFG